MLLAWVSKSYFIDFVTIIILLLLSLLALWIKLLLLYLWKMEEASKAEGANVVTSFLVYIRTGMSS